MKSFRADYVFPVCADPIKNGIVTVDDSGKIICHSDKPIRSSLKIMLKERLSGVICPGFYKHPLPFRTYRTLKDKVAPVTGSSVL
jgi:hypothetical protein